MAINTISGSGNAPAVVPSPTGGAAPVAKPEVVPTPAAASAQPSTEQVRKAVESMKQLVEPMAANSLQFSVDEDSGKTIVRVLDMETGELIRQIPSKELVEIAKSLDRLQGLLLRQQA